MPLDDAVKNILKEYAGAYSVRESIERRNPDAQEELMIGLNVRDGARRPIMSTEAKQYRVASRQEESAEQAADPHNNEGIYDQAMADANFNDDDRNSFYLSMLADGYVPDDPTDEVATAAKAAGVIKAIQDNVDNVQELRSALLQAGGFDIDDMLITETNGGMPGIDFYRAVAGQVSMAQKAIYDGVMANHADDVADAVKTKVGADNKYSLVAGQIVHRAGL